MPYGSPPAPQSSSRTPLAYTVALASVPETLGKASQSSRQNPKQQGWRCATCSLFQRVGSQSIALLMQRAGVLGGVWGLPGAHEDVSLNGASWPLQLSSPSRVTGALESRIQDFRCVYYNWEHLRCTWQPGRQAPPGARYELYYWYVPSRRASA